MTSAQAVQIVALFGIAMPLLAVAICAAWERVAGIGKEPPREHD